MARTDARLRQAYNSLLDLLAPLPIGASLMSEVKLAAALGVSRTVVRAVLPWLGLALLSLGIITYFPEVSLWLVQQTYPNVR